MHRHIRTPNMSTVKDLANGNDNEQCPNAFISKFEGASLTHVINVQGSRTQKLLNTQGIYSVVSAELKRRYPGLVAFMLDKKTVWCDKLDREFAKELKFTYLQ